MAGRVTRKAPELPLTVEERSLLAEARLTVAHLSEREPPSEALTELGYEQRQARADAARIAVSAIASGDIDYSSVTGLANVIYEFIWKGVAPDADLQG